MKRVCSCTNFCSGCARKNGNNAIVDFPDLVQTEQTEQMVVTLFMVLNDNHGNLFPMNLLQKVLNKLIVSFGGATVLPCGIGYWFSDEMLFADYVSLVQVVIPRGHEAIHRLTTIVAEWAQDLDQHEIFVYALPAYQPTELLPISSTVLGQYTERVSETASEPELVPNHNGFLT